MPSVFVLFDTGMQATELCRLRITDVDRAQGVLLVRGVGFQMRQLTLGQEGLRRLLAYLDDYRLRGGLREHADLGQEVLFLSETGRPLTKSCVTLLFARLRQRAGITRKGVTAALLRESFALRYLQAGGDSEALQEILGVKGRAAITRYERLCRQFCEDQMRKELPADPLS